MKNKILKNKGVTIFELLLVIAIVGIVSGIVINGFSSYNSGEALSKETEKVVEVLRHARSETMASKNAMQYGVHFASTSLTMFPGATYTQGNTDNIVYSLNSTVTIDAVNFSSGGFDAVFKRLSGESTASGTVKIKSTSDKVKNVKIYSTGVVESY